MATTLEQAPAECPTVPALVLVSEPQDWTDFVSGGPRRAGECDLGARLYGMRRMHKAFAGSGTICTGAAARIPGTIPNQALRAAAAQTGIVRIGHPSGVMPIGVEVQLTGSSSPVLRRAAIARTGRRLLDGTVYVPRAVVTEAARRAPARRPPSRSGGGHQDRVGSARPRALGPARVAPQQAQSRDPLR